MKTRALFLEAPGFFCFIREQIYGNETPGLHFSKGGLSKEPVTKEEKTADVSYI
jgi:hypothetical protein